MKIVSLLSWLCVVTSGALAAPFSATDFSAASLEAGQTHKIVLVDFYTTWCEPCKRLDKDTWADAGVLQALGQKTVALRIDAEKEVGLAKRYRINAYPTILLLRPDGTEIDRLVGYRPPAAFLAEFNSSLAGTSSVARARAKLQAAGEDNPNARMQFGQALAQNGQEAEALTEYLWCFDHGLEVSRAFAGVRLSFLLADINNLSRGYPQARVELQSRRDERQMKITGGSNDRQTLMDLVALNGALDEKAKNLVLFDQPPSDSAMRAWTARQIGDQLLEAKRYADFLLAGDARTAFQQRVGQIQKLLNSPGMSDASREAVEPIRRLTVTGGAQYFAALAGLHRNEEAQALAEQILKFDASEATRTALTAAAERAGNPELAHASFLQPVAPPKI